MKIKAEDYFRNEENIYEKMTGKKSGFVLEKVDGVYELSKNRVVFVQTKTAGEVRNFLDGFNFWKNAKEDILNEYSRWQAFYNSLPMCFLKKASRIAWYVVVVVLLVYPETRPAFRHYADILISYLLGTHSVPTGFASRWTYLIWQQLVFPVRWLVGLLPF